MGGTLTQQAVYIAAWPVVSLAFRSIPFVGYALLSSRVPFDVKIVAALLFIAVVLAADTLGTSFEEVAVYASLVFGTFVLVSIAIHGLRRALVRYPLPGPVVLAVAAAGYVGLPAFMLPNAWIVPIVVVGWEAMLSAYSYCQDTKGKEPGPRCVECVFFILVNPVLVYADRGRRRPAKELWRPGVSRTLLGLLTWTAQAVLTVAVASRFAQSNGSFSMSPGYSGFMGYCLTNALIFYLGHSALASVQIGLMRLCGWHVPERYNRPFLATSPSDFWRRWNIYVTSWARRYVFRPLALRLGQTQLGRVPALASAAVATFVVIGALHALSHHAAALAGETTQVSALQVTVAFLGFGLLFVAWEGLVRWKPRTEPVSEKGLAMRSVGAWLLFAHAKLTTLWLVFAEVL